MKTKYEKAEKKLMQVEEALIKRLSTNLMVVMLALAAGARADDAVPAVFHAGARVLFQGDSITDGRRDRAGTYSGNVMGQGYPNFQKLFTDACQHAPPEYWLFDGVHPAWAGHQLMADEWVSTVQAAWPIARPEIRVLRMQR